MLFTVVQVDILIPFYADTPLRQTIWNRNHYLWGDLPEANLCVADDPTRTSTGVFSPGRARNAAALKGTADWILAYGADETPPSPEVLQDTFQRARKHGWAPMYAGTRVLKPNSSEAFAKGIETEIEKLHLSTRVPSAMGLVLVTRDLFRKAGGYDTRFIGWGFEDSALRKMLIALAGIPPYAPSRQDCFSLSSRHVDLIALYRNSLPNRELYDREYASITEDDIPALFERRAAAVQPASTFQSSLAD